MMPDCSDSTVFFPMTRGGLVSSTLSNCAARRDMESVYLQNPRPQLHRSDPTPIPPSTLLPARGAWGHGRAAADQERAEG
jgi:hypothetical protein